MGCQSSQSPQSKTVEWRCAAQNTNSVRTGITFGFRFATTDDGGHLEGAIMAGMDGERSIVTASLLDDEGGLWCFI